MFKITNALFGKFTKIKLINQSTKEYISIIPEFGANVNEIILNKNKMNYSILDGAKDYNELAQNKGFNGAKLIPFPNRVNNGIYKFNEKTYQLPINFPIQKHAIHGLLYNKKFAVKKKNAGKYEASVELQYIYNKESPGYPFSFRTLLKYSLIKDKGFRCTTTIKNIGKNTMPIGDGWHPYFKTREKIDNLFFKIPSKYKIEVNNTGIPTGKIISFRKFSKLMKIGVQKLDTGFALIKKDGIASTEVYDSKLDLKIIVWQETGKMKYNFLQIFIPKSRKSIAIEPMTCNIDAFNSKNGLIILKPKQSFKASYGVRV